MAAPRTLLQDAEAALGQGGFGEARGRLDELDRSVLLRLSRDDSRLEQLRPYVFYRRALLARLRARGVRVGPELLRALFAAGSPRLILLVTHACQLRCAYCRVRRYPGRMSPQTAEAGIRWLLGGLRREVELQFFGGEPLLAFDVVRRAASLAARLAARAGKTARFLLTTNGLSLPDAALDFFREQGFRLEFSCDGDYSTQLRQRRAAGGRDYYARLARNLERLRGAGVDYQVIAVLTPENVGRVEEEFRYLAGLGHRRIQLNYALGRFWNARQEAALFAGMRRVSELAGELGVEFINSSSQRREPVVLNSELTVDCDGEVFRETGVCLEEDFRGMKSRFLVTRLGDAGLFDAHASTQFDNLALLVGAYGRGRLRRILLNNLDLGLRFDRRPPWEDA
ncbi:MAG: radical SAM protein [Elusimicrobia bacterium]|nr:radical SAM protein [Elusimicrobiota bacterium]